jgi:hypothetical protein
MVMVQNLAEVKFATPLVPLDFIENLIKNEEPATTVFRMGRAALGGSLFAGAGMAEPGSLVCNYPPVVHPRGCMLNRNLFGRVKLVAMFCRIHQGFLQA